MKTAKKYMKNKRIALHKSSLKTYLGEREENGKLFLTAGVVVARNRNPKEKVLSYFVNNLQIRPVRSTNIQSALT